MVVRMSRDARSMGAGFCPDVLGQLSAWPAGLLHLVGNGPALQDVPLDGGNDGGAACLPPREKLAHSLLAGILLSRESQRGELTPDAQALSHPVGHAFPRGLVRQILGLPREHHGQYQRDDRGGQGATGARA